MHWEDVLAGKDTDPIEKDFQRFAATVDIAALPGLLLAVLQTVGQQSMVPGKDTDQKPDPNAKSPMPPSFGPSGDSSSALPTENLSPAQ